MGRGLTVSRAVDGPALGKLPIRKSQKCWMSCANQFGLVDMAPRCS